MLKTHSLHFTISETQQKMNVEGLIPNEKKMVYEQLLETICNKLRSNIKLKHFNSSPKFRDEVNVNATIEEKRHDRKLHIENLKKEQLEKLGSNMELQRRETVSFRRRETVSFRISV